ncbi:hypothetical protein CTAYLR_002306 [Chrysophaeum taylorii]|uniref:PPIase cyclophilin-type domain-containing protein n=1 Tax=Chrysophaeum taylorii TaxID=2483200 RepID=A0AAD7XN43_9STRA|nr:hypothetical protein CTAYLR_002306 [Chrysophaeum taylorii]
MRRVFGLLLVPVVRGLTLQRRELLAAAVPRALALESPVITDVVSLELAIGQDRATLDLELFGDAAPASVETLVAFARGDLMAPCAETDDIGLARVKANQRNIERSCLNEQGVGVSLEGSLVWRIVPNRRIDLGRVSSRFAARIPPDIPVEHTTLRHKRGAVSVRRGGGSFEFTVAPRDNPTLDREDLVVVGQVSPATLQALDLINSIPSKRNPFDISDDPVVPPLGSNFARACEYTSPDATCAQFKPLRRIVVTRAKAASSLVAT